MTLSILTQPLFKLSHMYGILIRIADYPHTLTDIICLRLSLNGLNKVL